MAEETGATEPTADTIASETDITPAAGPIVVPVPAGGQEIVIQVMPGQTIDLQVIAVAAVTLVAEGDDLRIDFGAPGSILLTDFLAAAASDAPPVLLIGGEVEIPAEAIIAALESDGLLEPAADDDGAPPVPPGNGADFTPVGLLDPTATETSALLPQTQLPTSGEFAVEALLGPTGLTFATPGGADDPFLGLTALDGDGDGDGDGDAGGTAPASAGAVGGGGSTPAPGAADDGPAAPAPAPDGPDDGPAAPTPPTATLSLTPAAGGGPGLAINEDTSGTINVSAQSGNDGALGQIVITGLDPSWTYDLSGLQAGGGTASLVGGALTISGLSGTTYAGELHLTPPTDSDLDLGALNGTVTAISTADPTLAATASGSLGVTVNAVADAPTVTTPPAAGNEDSAIALNIGAALADTDGSESITSITISGVPAGAALSAGTHQGGGVWTLTPAQLAGLTITPPADSDTDFQLTVAATSQEAANGDTATTTAILDVTVTPVNDPPVNSLPGAQTVLEDQLLVFSAANGNAITIGDIDAGTGTLETMVSVDTGRLTATAAGGAIVAGNNSSTLTISGTLADINATLDGLGYRGPTDAGANATLTITTNDQGNTGSGGALTDTDTLNITVVPDADQPTVSLQVLDGGGNPNTQIIPNETVVLRVSANFGDFTDGSETHTVSVTLPRDYEFVNTSATAANLSVLVPNPNSDGLATLTLKTGQGSITNFDITLTAPNSIPVNSQISVVATATAVEASNADTATATQTVTVDATTPPDIPAPVDDSVTVSANDTVTGNLTANDNPGDNGWPAGNRITLIKDEPGNEYSLGNPNGATVNGTILEDIPTTEGGLLTVDFATGDFTYTPPTARTPPGILHDGFDRINYTVQDIDGDTGNADLRIQITDALVVDTQQFVPNLFGTTTDDVMIGDPSADQLTPFEHIQSFNHNDPLNDGNDIIFADVPNTAALVTALQTGNDPQGVVAGSIDLTGVTAGWPVFQELIDNHGWTEQTVKDYVRNPANWDDLNDPTQGSSVIDRVLAGPGDDVIFGGGGGGVGNEIIGGTGNDIMYGGNTVDRFVWRANVPPGSTDADGSTDEIRGFSIVDDDILDLAGKSWDPVTDFVTGDDVNDFVTLDTSGPDATFSVDSNGTDPGGDTVTIVLKGVDKTTLTTDLGLAGTATDQDIVTAMHTQGNLVIA